MATLVAPPSREVLQNIDTQAWQLYHDLCWNPEASAEDRRKAFDAALASLMMLLDHDRRERIP